MTKYYVETSCDGTQRWYNQDKLLHREEGPAVIYPNGIGHHYLYGSKLSKEEWMFTLGKVILKREEGETYISVPSFNELPELIIKLMGHKGWSPTFINKDGEWIFPLNYDLTDVVRIECYVEKGNQYVFIEKDSQGKWSPAQLGEFPNCGKEVFTIWELVSFMEPNVRKEDIHPAIRDCYVNELLISTD